MEWLRARLIDRCKEAWRLWSVWMHVASTTLIGVLLMAPAMPAEIQGMVPQPYRAILIGAWAIAGIAARLLKQGGGNGAR